MNISHSPSSLVKVEEGSGIATITFTRGNKRNALNTEIRSFLASEIKRLNKNDDVKVIVLTGEDPAFSAGVDFKELEELKATGAPLDKIGPLSEPFFTSDIPVIGAINGPAITGGLELALTCHFLIASEKAVFADTHSELGLMPGWGATVNLPRAIGEARAQFMLTTGERIDAQKAYEWGLVTEVVTHDSLMMRVHEIANAIAKREINVLRRLGKIYNQTRQEVDKNRWLLEQREFISIWTAE